jgi:hypothetical protein
MKLVFQNQISEWLFKKKEKQIKPILKHHDRDHADRGEDLFVPVNLGLDSDQSEEIWVQLETRRVYVGQRSTAKQALLRFKHWCVNGIWKWNVKIVEGEIDAIAWRRELEPSSLLTGFKPPPDLTVPYMGDLNPAGDTFTIDDVERAKIAMQRCTCNYPNYDPNCQVHGDRKRRLKTRLPRLGVFGDDEIPF